MSLDMYLHRKGVQDTVDCAYLWGITEGLGWKGDSL